MGRWKEDGTYIDYQIEGEVKLSGSYVGHDYDFLEYAVLAVEISGNKIFAKGTNNTDIYKSTDNGRTWVHVGTTTNPVNKGHYTSTGKLILFDSMGQILRSIDDGQTFTVVLTGIRAPLFNGIDSNGDTIIFGEYTMPPTDTVANVYKSSDGGLTWNSVLQETASDDPVVGIRHFHTVKFSRQVGSLWFATSGDGDSQSRFYQSVTGDSGNWVETARGNRFRAVGIVGLPNKTMLWGSDQAQNTFVFAGNVDDFANTTRRVAPIHGHALGIAGGAKTIMMVTRIENSDVNGDLQSCVYVSYDAGATWQIEYYVIANGFAGFDGILGPDRKGNFYLAAHTIEETNKTNNTIKATPKKGYNKPIAAIDHSYSKRNIVFPVFKNEQVRVSASTYGRKTPNDLTNYSLEVRNTAKDGTSTPISVRIRMKTATGHIKDSAGQIVEFNAASTDDGSLFFSTEQLKVKTIPKDTLFTIYYATAPTSGDLTITLRGEETIPNDHRLLSPIEW